MKLWIFNNEIYIIPSNLYLWWSEFLEIIRFDGQSRRNKIVNNL